MTRKVREMPYLDSPNMRAWWVTTSCAILRGVVTVASQAGMKRCISPYRRTFLMAVARKALREQP